LGIGRESEKKHFGDVEPHFLGMGACLILGNTVFVGHAA